MSLENAAAELRTALNSLRDQHARLTTHIANLEKMLSDLSKSSPGRRAGPGRPKASRGGGARVRKKPNWSPAAREAARERMRAYWASRRKGKG